MSLEFDETEDEYFPIPGPRNAAQPGTFASLDFDIDEDEDGNVFLDAVVDQWLPAIPAIGILWEF